MNIVIVGGGTAGWLSAFFISKAQPNKHKITVIESSAIGIIGTGEATTGIFLDVLSGGFFNKPYKIDLKEFMIKTDATEKKGIYHINWGKTPGSYFAPIDISPTGKSMNDYFFKYVLATQGNSKAHLASKIGLEYEHKDKSNIYALHFDGQKVSKFFKEICIKEDNVKLIDSVVKNIELDESGSIKSILLNNDQTIKGDLFVDCTGFARILMKKLDVKWVSYKKFLPVDSAIPFLMKHKKGENIIPAVQARALSSGWMWCIPLTTRKGCGYVYDSRFLTKEQALRELEEVTQSEVEPIKHISFENGSSEYFWKNNVICMGLSSSFMEPLESTSIHNTILQLIYFVLEFLSENKSVTINPENQRIYNRRMSKLNFLTADFISMHYQGGREDTEFWKYIKNEKVITDNAREIVELLPHKIPGFFLLDGMWGSYSIPLANWIFAGMGMIDPKIAMRDLKKSGMFDVSKQQYEMFKNSILNKL